MNRYQKIINFACSFFVTALVVSCGSEEGEPVHYHSVTDKIMAEGKFYNPDSMTLTSDQYTAHIKTIEITEGEFSFLIPERKGQIKSFECSECHTESLSKMQDSKKGKKAHWNIKINHADSTTMNCKTCHNGEDMNNLKTLTNEKVDFNLSYKLCAQCHSSQFKDWKGGAHGKRLGGWAPPRVSNTCVNCHNPHKPHIESRWPARFNTQKVLERN